MNIQLGIETSHLLSELGALISRTSEPSIRNHLRTALNTINAVVADLGNDAPSIELRGTAPGSHPIILTSPSTGVVESSDNVRSAAGAS